MSLLGAAWTYNDEVRFIRTIISPAMIRGYVQSLPGRVNWGSITRADVNAIKRTAKAHQDLLELRQ